MEVSTILKDLLNSSGAALVLLVLSFIKIPKIEVNVWGLIGRAVTKEVLVKIDEIDDSVKDIREKFNDHVNSQNVYIATKARQRILRFNDEIVSGSFHSKEHFDDILEQIDRYENYCSEHPDYQNNKCVLAIKNIKNVYEIKCKDKSTQN